MNKTPGFRVPVTVKSMEFFAEAINTLKVLVIALGAGLTVWGVINLLEGYGSDNPGANAHVNYTNTFGGRYSVKLYPPSRWIFCSCSAARLRRRNQMLR